MADAFGNALGNSIVGQIESTDAEKQQAQQRLTTEQDFEYDEYQRSFEPGTQSGLTPEQEASEISLPASTVAEQNLEAGAPADASQPEPGTDTGGGDTARTAQAATGQAQATDYINISKAFPSPEPFPGADQLPQSISEQGSTLSTPPEQSSSLLDSIGHYAGLALKGAGSAVVNFVTQPLLEAYDLVQVGLGAEYAAGANLYNYANTQLGLGGPTIPEYIDTRFVSALGQSEQNGNLTTGDRVHNGLVAVPVANVGVGIYDAGTALSHGNYDSFAEQAGGIAAGIGIGAGIDALGDYTVRSPIVPLGAGELGSSGIKGFQSPLSAPDTPFSPIVSGGGLQSHEDAGGHLLDLHVGQSEAQLVDRLNANSGISGASSFFDRPTAEDAVSQALDANQSNIEMFLAGSANRLSIDYSLTNPVGISVTRGASGAVDASSLRLILVRNPSFSTGYNILTGFPTTP